MAPRTVCLILLILRESFYISFFLLFSCIHVSLAVAPRTVCLILLILRESFYISFFFNLTIYSAAFSSASIAASLTAFILHWKFQTATKTMKIKLINIITEVDKEVFCLTLNLNHDITNMIRPITRTGTHFEYTLDHCYPPVPRNTWWINMCAFMHPKLRCVIYLNELLLNKRYYLVSGKIIGLYKYFRIGIEWNLSFVVCHLFTMSCLVKRSPSPHVTLSSGSISQIV